MRILASPAFSNEKINPYNALLYREINAIQPVVTEYSHRRALLQRYDILHFHWPDGYINDPRLVKALRRILLLMIVIGCAKLKGGRIVWTVHNIVPHDAHHAQLSRMFMNWFVERCDGLIFMSEQSKLTFSHYYNLQHILPAAIIPHGHYRNSYPPAIDQIPAKALLTLPTNKKVILSLGMIKPYKNIDQLIEVFLKAKLDDYVLVIAGNTESVTLAKKLKALAGESKDILLFIKYIPDNELHIYFSAADVVILPYKSILNSGALLLALSFNKPVIAPHMGAFIALQEELGRRWVTSYDAELQTNTLIEAINELQQTQREDTCPLSHYNWDKLAHTTVDFYRSLLPGLT